MYKFLSNVSVLGCLHQVTFLVYCICCVFPCGALDELWVHKAISQQMPQQSHLHACFFVGTSENILGFDLGDQILIREVNLNGGSEKKKKTELTLHREFRRVEDLTFTMGKK